MRGKKDILASFCNIFLLHRSNCLFYNGQETEDCQIKEVKVSMTAIAGKGFAWGQIFAWVISYVGYNNSNDNHHF